MPISIRKENGSVSNTAATDPVARGPITFAGPRERRDGWELTGGRAGAALTITDLAPLAKLVVRAPAGGAVQDALGTGFGRAGRTAGLLGGALVIGAGPGEWLVLGPPEAGAGLATSLARIAEDSGEFTSVVDVTHGRALVRLRGAAADALLAKVCAIDLSDPVTPDRAAFRSSVARVVTDVVRDDVGGERSYLLHCERSSGQYLADSLLDAGHEFGIETALFEAPGI